MKRTIRFFLSRLCYFFFCLIFYYRTLILSIYSAKKKNVSAIGDAVLFNILFSRRRDYLRFSLAERKILASIVVVRRLHVARCARSSEIRASLLGSVGNDTVQQIGNCDVNVSSFQQILLYNVSRNERKNIAYLSNHSLYLHRNGSMRIGGSSSAQSLRVLNDVTLLILKFIRNSERARANVQRIRDFSLHLPRQNFVIRIALRLHVR